MSEEQKEMSAIEIAVKKIQDLSAVDIVNQDLTELTKDLVSETKKTKRDEKREWMEKNYPFYYEEKCSAYKRTFIEHMYKVEDIFTAFNELKNNLEEDEIIKLKEKCDKLFNFINKYDDIYVSSNKLETSEINKIHIVINELHADFRNFSHLLKFNYNFTPDLFLYTKQMFKVDIKKAPEEFLSFEYVLAELDKFNEKEIKSKRNNNEVEKYSMYVMYANALASFIRKHSVQTSGLEYDKHKKLWMECVRAINTVELIRSLSETTKMLVDEWYAEIASYEEFKALANPKAADTEDKPKKNTRKQSKEE